MGKGRRQPAALAEYIRRLTAPAISLRFRFPALINAGLGGMIMKGKLDGSPATCIGLGVRNSKGVISSREAKASSSARICGKGGRCRGFAIQHPCAMFQSSIIFEGMSSGIAERVPLNTASGTCHDCLNSSKGILPDRTYDESMRPGRITDTPRRKLTS